MEQLTTGARYTGTVTGYTSEGQGVVKPDGAVVFVPGAVRGETVELEIVRVMQHAALGKLVHIIEPSPARQTPDCPYFGRCGGCDFRHISYEEELRAKRQRVQDALRRIGGTDAAVEEILPAAHPVRYRNKAQYPVSASGIGFYRAGSHTVIPVADCLLLPEAARQTAAAVRTYLARYAVPPYDETAGTGLVRHVYVRTNRAGESLCCITANGKKLPREPELVGLVRAAVPKTAGVLLNTNTEKTNVILGDRFRLLWGRDFLEDTLCGLTFRLSVPSFYQVNAEQAEVLYQKALQYADLSGRETVLDLYCGIGTLTLCLAKEAGRVIGAEVVAQAVADAEANAARNGIKNTEFFCADASETAARLAAEGLKPDVVTVDPPRKGLTPAGIAAIASMGPDRVVYVSCDPGTLGRDVKRFAEWGYTVRRAAAVDLFPRTRHVESVALLSL